MDASSFLNQILRQLSFPFRDGEWLKKIAIGSALTLSMFILPLIPGLIVIGYAKRIMQRIIVEDGEPFLPEWNEWGKMLSDGVKLWGAALIYGLPMSLMGVIFITTLFIAPPLLLFLAQIPDKYIGLLFLLWFLLFLAGMFVLVVAGFVTALVVAPAQSHLVARDRFSAAFSFQEWWPVLKKGWTAFVIAILTPLALSFLSSILIQVVGMTVILAPLVFVIWLPVTFLVNLYTYAFYAMAYREGAALHRRAAVQ